MSLRSWKRAKTLAKRFRAARRLGVHFPGQTRFVFPREIRLSQGTVSLSAPEEPTLRNDFVDLILDDDYGVGSIEGEVKTIVDIGANIGIFSMWARHHFPEARIETYEPNPRIVPYLEGNVRGQDVIVYPEGVGGISRSAVMCDDGRSRLATTTVPDDRAKEVVPIVSIGEVVDRAGGRVDFLKIDAEGAEWEIFRAASALTNVGMIRMEYHLFDGKTVEEFMELVQGAGFQIDYLDENQGYGIAWLSRGS